jgi:hypothetical protein
VIPKPGEQNLSAPALPPPRRDGGWRFVNSKKSAALPGLRASHGKTQISLGNSNDDTQLRLDNLTGVADFYGGLGFPGRWAYLAVPDALILFSGKLFEPTKGRAGIEMLSHNGEGRIWFLPIKDMPGTGIPT